MKLSTRVLALTFSAVLTASLAAQTPAILGTWQGTATTRNGQAIFAALQVTSVDGVLKVALLNGPAAHPELSPASSASFDGRHLVAGYDYFARRLEATLAGDTLTGTYGSVAASSKAPPIPFRLRRVAKPADPVAAPGAPDLRGSWEIATTSAKGESAWEFRIDPPVDGSRVIKTVIQRIDGDTGGLWGTWDGTRYVVGHLNAAGLAAYSVTPQADGTLLLKNLNAPPPATEPTADLTHPPAPTEFIARRTVDARRQNLPPPTDPMQQTSVQDPAVPFAFSFPDLSGKTVANTDPQFRDKVVIVAIGGSWCPNCHDEAPFLVRLYKRFHAQGLEIVGLDFEQGDPETDTPRLKAFIAHYGIPYPMLTAGTTDQLAEKIPQGVNLNCWPTSFFLDRTGRVRLVHAGFAGPGNTQGHQELERQVTSVVEKLLAEPAVNQTAGR